MRPEKEIFLKNYLAGGGVFRSVSGLWGGSGKFCRQEGGRLVVCFFAVVRDGSVLPD